MSSFLQLNCYPFVDNNDIIIENGRTKNYQDYIYIDQNLQK